MILVNLIGSSPVKTRRSLKAKEYWKRYTQDPEKHQKRIEYMRKYNAANREKQRQYSLKYGQENYYKKTRNYRLWKKFKLSHSGYLLMLEKQGHGCAICHNTSPGINRRYFCIDHDHTSGKIRGLLCNTCNRGIGLLQDSESILLAAAAYLKRNT